MAQSKTYTQTSSERLIQMFSNRQAKFIALLILPVTTIDDETERGHQAIRQHQHHQNAVSEPRSDRLAFRRGLQCRAAHRAALGPQLGMKVYHYRTRIK